MFKIIELEGFNSKELLKEYIYKSLTIENFTIQDELFEVLFSEFSGHLRYSYTIFIESIYQTIALNSLDVSLATMISAISKCRQQIKDWEELTEKISS
jgi:hypothetical protein